MTIVCRSSGEQETGRVVCCNKVVRFRWSACASIPKGQKEEWRNGGMAATNGQTPSSDGRKEEDQNIQSTEGLLINKVTNLAKQNYQLPPL